VFLCFHRSSMHGKCATSRPCVTHDTHEFTHVWYLENGWCKLTWCVEFMHGPNVKQFMQTYICVLNENLHFRVEFQLSDNGMLNTCVFRTNICYIWQRYRVIKQMIRVSPLKTSFLFALSITRPFTNFRLKLSALSISNYIPL
jgi:hypothetical protein